MSTEGIKVTAIIVAAGKGTRFNDKGNKPFVDFCSKPLVCHCIDLLSACKDVDEIILAVAPENISAATQMLERTGKGKVSKIVAGGDTRQMSVYNALKSCDFDNSSIVLVHDGARPCVPVKLTQEIINTTAACGACVPGLTPKATVKQVDEDNTACRTINRATLRLVQTPQGFMGQQLLEAYEKFKDRLSDFTDDASIAEAAGMKVKIIPGDERNIKITTPIDQQLGELFISSCME